MTTRHRPFPGSCGDPIETVDPPSASEYMIDPPEVPTPMPPTTLHHCAIDRSLGRHRQHRCECGQLWEGRP